MNIDDILAEAGADATIQQSHDLQDLSRAWVTERSAPEILPWPDPLMERILERIHKQVELKLVRKKRMSPMTNLALSLPRSSWWNCKPATRTLRRIFGSSLSKPSLNDSSSLYDLSCERGLQRLSLLDWIFLIFHMVPYLTSFR